MSRRPAKAPRPDDEGDRLAHHREIEAEMRVGLAEQRERLADARVRAAEARHSATAALERAANQRSRSTALRELGVQRRNADGEERQGQVRGRNGTLTKCAIGAEMPAGRWDVREGLADEHERAAHEQECPADVRPDPRRFVMVRQVR